MYYNGIRLYLDGAKPGIKFFLIRWLYKYGTDSVAEKVKAIAKELDVTDRVVSESIVFLVEYGYFSKEKSSIGKGRPSYIYKCTDSLIASLNKFRNIPKCGTHRVLIDDLVTAYKCKNKSHKLNSFSNTTKLLLIIMVSFSDECGVIRNLGFSEISKFTGMDRDRFHRHLLKLKEHGYVLANVPGTTGKYLMGVAKGVFFLDLGSENFRKNSNVKGLLSYNSNHIVNFEPQIIKLRRLVRKVSNTVQKNKVESDDICDLVNCTKQDFLTLVSFLKHENRLEVWHYMQLKIDECASILLSNYWEYVEASSELTGKLHHVLQPCHILSQKVVVKLENSNEYLSSDILLEGNSNAEQVSDKLEILNKAIEEQKETKIIYDTLVKVITYYSGLLARQVKSVMCLVPDHPYENMNHAILPISNGKLESLRTNFKVISSYKNEKHTQKIVANLTSKIKEHHRRDISLLNIIVNDKDYPDAIYKHAKLHA